MISFIKLRYFFLPILLFCSFSLLEAQSLGNISMEELEAFEQELAKMSPEQWQALENEINSTINSMSEEDRQKLFAEAALEAERLEAEYNAVRNQQPPTRPASRDPLPDRASFEQAKKTTPAPVKLKVDQTEKSKLAGILLNLSDNLDDLHLLVAEQPLLKTKLAVNDKWQKFITDYYLLHSLINSLINNDHLQDNLLQSDWDTLRSEIVNWDKALDLIEEIQLSDNDASLSRSESALIEKTLTDLLTQHSSENLVWSLKRMFTKYAETEIKNLEQLTKDSKAIYRFPEARRDKIVTSANLLPKQKPAVAKKAPNIYTHKSSAAAKSAAKLKDKELAKKNNDAAAKPKDSPKKGGDSKKDAKPEKKDAVKKSEKVKKADKKEGKDEQDDKSEKSILVKPNSKFVADLKRTAKLANSTASKLDKQLIENEQADEPQDVADLLRNSNNELLQIFSELRNEQADLLQFYDQDGKLDPVVVDGLDELLGNKNPNKANPLTKAALHFAELKKQHLPDISSIDVVLAVNKDKFFGMADRLGDKADDYRKFIMQDSIKAGKPKEVGASLFLQPEYLIANIADRLLTFAALADPQKKSASRDQALRMLRQIRS
jgi:hypothetical protein